MTKFSKYHHLLDAVQLLDSIVFWTPFNLLDAVRPSGRRSTFWTLPFIWTLLVFWTLFNLLDTTRLLDTVQPTGQYYLLDTAQLLNGVDFLMLHNAVCLKIGGIHIKSRQLVTTIQVKSVCQGY